MRTFIIIWLGQIVSTIGSYMTVFALTIWVWQVTGSATALTLVSFFVQLPRLLITPFSGIIVDRFNRKQLMLLGDIVAFLCTLTVGLLHFTNRLEVWHLYCVVGIYGGFGQIQTLAYSASIALIVPKEQYTRAGSMSAAVNYASAIISPALAGGLYPIIGLGGIIAIDITTFAAGLMTLLISHIPQPPLEQSSNENPIQENIWQKLTFGFRYIFAKPPLLAMAIAFTLFALPNDIGKVLYNPLILARTNGDSQILGNVTTAAGLGGIVGALLLSTWGGFKRKIHGMLIGFIGAGFFRAFLAFTQIPWVWMSSMFLSTMHTPLFYSSSNAIWYAKVPSSLQGRVLAADQSIGVVISLTAPLIAGPLADKVFEPAMQPDGSLAPILGSIFGTGDGAGISVIYAIASFLMLMVGIGGYFFPTLRHVEQLLPDCDTEPK
ncbi:MFS transporter [Plectonema cf. radiosum LEGE 06105]|uniref:MFS transporter n=1 Tax=Plectonema cf. radiosum LEGE 06105 TaxID=945769 RepID=A0A8J7F2N2_9CYAN|nr:MFS transporter [Plectonema radiosum]MBE9215023.1 MFS transporter [Plectonema cf. radiosum LEGE 06105]